jgi:hypothetical protein
MQADIIASKGPASKPKPLTTFLLSSYIYWSFSTGRASPETEACPKRTNMGSWAVVQDSLLVPGESGVCRVALHYKFG